MKINRQADFGIADLHYTPHHLNIMDLSIPYTSQCLTFLTPESLTDNSWKTLILPFRYEKKKRKFNQFGFVLLVYNTC